MLTDSFHAMFNSGLKLEYLSTKKYKTMNDLGFIAMMSTTDINLCDAHQFK